jgi:hypothetical protein
MLDCVGHVSLLARDLSFGQSPVEQTPGGSDEGMALAIFLISWLFSDKNDAGFSRSRAENRLGGIFVQVASSARARRGAQGVKRVLRGQESSRGALAFCSHESRVASFVGDKRYADDRDHRHAFKAPLDAAGCDRLRLIRVRHPVKNSVILIVARFTMASSHTDPDNKTWRHPGGKLLRAGPAALTEAELLAIVISAGTAKNPAEKIAGELIDKFHSLRGIARQPLDELMRIEGLGQVKLCRIAAALEIGRRFANQESQEPSR